MTLYRCPRDDLGCTALFPTTGDLDDHLRARHEYGRVWRLTSSLGHVRVLPVGPKAQRRVPGGRAARTARTAGAARRGRDGPGARARSTGSGGGTRASG
ncbi:hypothetical protein [Parafrankia discariae]|uniref:hypothetical protein n=1 Tax=Parafrankia discariae TaxID=365528 RepID=UPI0003671F44|nr:hypothetical protein [Parafrankia discariae]